MMHKIEKGIPIGPETRGRRSLHQEFMDMNVSDPEDPINAESVPSKTRTFGTTAAAWGKLQKPKRIFYTPWIEEEGGYRTWRIK